MTKDSQAFDLKRRLIDKSVEAYVLSLGIINRFTIEYRIETFCYLLCNARELLIEAKIIQDSHSGSAIYYYKAQEDRLRRSLSLRDCLN